jgi:hypothetical protein
VSQPLDDQIISAIVTSLGQIVADAGVTYWHTPGKVIRSHGFTERCLDGTYASVYVVIPDRTETEKAGSKRVSSETFLDIVLAQKTSELEIPTSQPDPSRSRIQQQMVADVKKKLLSGSMTLGIADASLEDVNVPMVEYGPEVQTQDAVLRQLYAEGWILAVLRVAVKYAHFRTAA